MSSDKKTRVQVTISPVSDTDRELLLRIGQLNGPSRGCLILHLARLGLAYEKFLHQPPLPILERAITHNLSAPPPSKQTGTPLHDVIDAKPYPAIGAHQDKASGVALCKPDIGMSEDRLPEHRAAAETLQEKLHSVAASGRSHPASHFAPHDADDDLNIGMFD